MQIFEALMPKSVSPSIRAEQIRMLYAHSLPVQVLALVTGLIFVATFWHLLDHAMLIIWLVFFLLLSFFRIASAIMFIRVPPQTHAELEKWGNAYLLAAFLAGVLWGTMCLYYSHHWPPSHQVIMFGVFTGLIAAAFNANASLLSAFTAFYLPTVGGMFYMMVSAKMEGYLALLTLYFFYAVVMYVSAMMFHNRLTLSLQARIENESLLAQLAESNAKLLHLAEIDQLTGISNRRAMDRYLKYEWNRLCRATKPLSLLFIDIDYFKQYNDTYGHDGGDKCLVNISQILVSHCRRSNDMVARFGGEEFAIILPETTEADALIIANGILTELEQLKIPHLGSLIVQYLTLSIGVASMTPHQLDSEAELLLAADAALYKAKHSGRMQIASANVEFKRMMETVPE